MSTSITPCLATAPAAVTPPPVDFAAVTDHPPICHPEALARQGGTTTRRERLSRGKHEITRTWFTAENQNFMREEWHNLTPSPDRTTGPASRLWLLRGGARILLLSEWRRDGALHRTTGPASQAWAYMNGKRYPLHERWARVGNLHRIGGPACQEWQLWHGRSLLVKRQWYHRGLYHCVDGPACQEWLIRHGQRLPKYVAWFQKGLPRRRVANTVALHDNVVAQRFRLDEKGEHVLESLAHSGRHGRVEAK